MFAETLSQSVVRLTLTALVFMSVVQVWCSEWNEHDTKSYDNTDKDLLRYRFAGR